MTFQSPNKADNITLAAAQVFVDKLNRLGFRLGELYLDDDDAVVASGATRPSEVPDLDPTEKYNVLVFGGGDWHNVAQMVRMWGGGTLQDFAEVWTDVYGSFADPNRAILNIPGAQKAIEKLIEKAGA